MSNEGPINGPTPQPPTPEAAVNLPSSGPTSTEQAGFGRWQQLSDTIGNIRTLGGAFNGLVALNNGGTAASRRARNENRVGALEGSGRRYNTDTSAMWSLGFNDRGQRIYGRFRQNRQGRDRLPQSRFDRQNQLRPSPQGALSEEQVQQALATLTINGQPLAFNSTLPNSLNISSVESVRSYMRRNNISPLNYQNVVQNLRKATADLPAALSARPEWQGASITYSCDGNRVWATCQQGGRTISAFSTGNFVMFMDGPPAIPNGRTIPVMTDGNVRLNWSLNAGGGNAYEGNGRRLYERISTGNSSFQMNGVAGFRSASGVYIARVSNPNAMLPNPQALDGRAGAPSFPAGRRGMFLYMPNTSQLPGAYRSLAEQGGGWLPPPQVLLNLPGDPRRNEQQLLEFAASLDLETSNAWLTGIFANTDDGVGWRVQNANMTFDERRGNYNGFQALRQGRGGCMQIADLGVRILRQRGMNAVTLVVESDHTAAVAITQVSDGYQLVVFDSNGVTTRPVAPSPVAALQSAWQDDRHPRPARAEFIDDNYNSGYISYEELAQRMMGGRGSAPNPGPNPGGSSFARQPTPNGRSNGRNV